jgi:hypothetical protein
MSDYFSDCDSQYDDYWYEDDEEFYDESLDSCEGYHEDSVVGDDNYSSFSEECESQSSALEEEDSGQDDDGDSDDDSTGPLFDEWHDYQQHSDRDSQISYDDYESSDDNDDSDHHIDEWEREQLQSWLESMYNSFCDFGSESIDGQFASNREIRQQADSLSHNRSSCSDEEEECDQFLQMIDDSSCVQFSSEPGSTTFCLSSSMFFCDKSARHLLCEDIPSAFSINSGVPSIQELSWDSTPDLVSPHTDECAVSPPKLSNPACSDFSKLKSIQYLSLPITSNSCYPTLAFICSLNAFELGRDPPWVLSIGDSRFGFG